MHGWVRTQNVDLVGIRAQIELAHRCRYTPKLAPDSRVLRYREIRAAECRTRPYDGDLTLFVRAEGGSLRPLATRWTVEAGKLDLRFSDLERLLREAGLSDASEIELGRDGWAGRVNLAPLRELLASWHLHWIGKGRGSAALYVAAHPQDPKVDEVRALAVEAQLARQEADYLAVSRGELSPRAFLDRHLWSPYRLSVREMRKSENEPANAPQVPVSPP